MEMKIGKLRFASCCLMILLVIGCNQKQTKVNANSPGLDETGQVEQAIRNVFAWAENKDFDLFYSTLANDTDFISVTPYERVKFGFSAVREDSAFWGDPSFKAVGYDISDLRIRFSGDKTVAWFYCVLNDFNTLNNEPANWLNARWTGVLEKREGRWVVVQQHFSWAR